MKKPFVKLTGASDYRDTLVIAFFVSPIDGQYYCTRIGRKQVGTGE